MGPAFESKFAGRETCAIGRDPIRKGDLVRFVSNDLRGTRVLVHDHCAQDFPPVKELMEKPIYSSTKIEDVL